MFESMPRASADEPNIFRAWMPVDQKVSARCVLILANARLHDRRSAQRRESALDVNAYLLRRRFRHNPGLRIGIDTRSVLVERNLESARLEVGHPIVFVALKKKCGQRRGCEPQIARRHAKKINLLPGWKNPLAQDVGKNLPQPRAASKNESLRLKLFAATRPDG